MRAKHRPAFDPGNPDSFLQHAMSGDGLQMMFASLKKDVIKTVRQTEEVGARWQSASEPTRPRARARVVVLRVNAPRLEWPRPRARFATPRPLRDPKVASQAQRRVDPKGGPRPTRFRLVGPRRRAALMKTAGVVTTVYATDVGQLLLSDADGHALQVKEFVLQQPETESFRWKEKDFYPAGAAPPKKETAARLDAVKRRTGEEPKPDAEKAASGKKTKSKKGKAAKKSAEKPAEKQDL